MARFVRRQEVRHFAGMRPEPRSHNLRDRAIDCPKAPRLDQQMLDQVGDGTDWPHHPKLAQMRRQPLCRRRSSTTQADSRYPPGKRTVLAGAGPARWPVGPINTAHGPKCRAAATPARIVAGRLHRPIVAQVDGLRRRRGHRETRVAARSCAAYCGNVQLPAQGPRHVPISPRRH